MHEVGHTLGLRHNFKATTMLKNEQLHDTAITRKQGCRRLGDGLHAESTSPRRGPSRATTSRPPSAVRLLGDRVRLQAALGRHGRRGGEAPEDRHEGPSPAWITPPTRTCSSASIPSRCRSTWATTPSASPGSGSRSPRTCSSARNHGARLPTRTTPAEALGQLRDPRRRPGSQRPRAPDRRRAHVRDAPGTGRDPLTPVPVAEQRDALDVITGSLLSADSLRVSAHAAAQARHRLQRTLGSDPRRPRLDPDRLLAIRAAARPAALAAGGDERHRRHPPSRKQREGALGNDARAANARAVLAPVAGGVEPLDSHAVDIGPLRREVQRDHANRIAALLLRPGAASRADTRSVVRVQARQLLERIRTASKRPGLSEEAQAHPPTAPTPSTRRSRPDCSARRQFGTTRRGFRIPSRTAWTLLPVGSRDRAPTGARPRLCHPMPAAFAAGRTAAQPPLPVLRRTGPPDGPRRGYRSAHDLRQRSCPCGLPCRRSSAP